MDVEVALHYQHATMERDRALTARIDSEIRVDALDCGSGNA